jgi:hypothetical protein
MEPSVQRPFRFQTDKSEAKPRPLNRKRPG